MSYLSQILRLGELPEVPPDASQDLKDLQGAGQAMIYGGPESVAPLISALGVKGVARDVVQTFQESNAGQNTIADRERRITESSNQARAVIQIMGTMGLTPSVSAIGQGGPLAYGPDIVTGGQLKQWSDFPEVTPP
jgi:hypothetical protein